MTTICEYRGIQYSIPGNHDGVWRYRIHFGHLRKDETRPPVFRSEGHPTQAEALEAASERATSGYVESPSTLASSPSSARGECAFRDAQSHRYRFQARRRSGPPSQLQIRASLPANAKLRRSSCVRPVLLGYLRFRPNCKPPGPFFGTARPAFRSARIRTPGPYEKNLGLPHTRTRRSCIEPN